MELTAEEQAELQLILKTQADITAYEVSTFCAAMCDKHRGHLQVGEMIRQHFGLDELAKHIPVNPNPKPKQEDFNFESAPVSAAPKKSYLTRVK